MIAFCGVSETNKATDRNEPTEMKLKVANFQSITPSVLG